MSYIISKSKYKTLNLLLNKKQNNNEMIEISDEKYAEFKSIDPSLNCVQIPSKYYWYISLTAPTDIQTVDNPAGTAQEGWHLIGTSTDGYVYDASALDTLFSAPQNLTESECIWYVALPQNTPLKIYDQQGKLQMTDIIGTVQCGDITYDVRNYGPLWQWDAYIIR